MLTSLVDPSRCADVKKRVYMPPVADEYNSSSQPLNGEEVAQIVCPCWISTIVGGWNFRQYENTITKRDRIFDDLKDVL